MKSKSKELTYTPRTFGALHEQLEFDFGPEFIGVPTKTTTETNSKGKQLRSHNNKVVSKKTGGRKNGR
jgi:hypothetical protein